MAQMKTTLHMGATRYEQTVTFSGVDLTDPRFQVPEGMAIDSNNYVWRDGAVRKRHGYADISYVFDYMPTEESLKYYSESSGKILTSKKETPVYDIWTIGNYYVVHKGVFLYVIPCANAVSYPKGYVVPVNSGYTSEGGVSVPVVLPMPSRKMSAFVGNGRLWILTGTWYVVLGKDSNGDWRLSKVSEGEDVFVPKTTTGITEKDSGVGARATYEAVNMLTPLRENGLASGVTKDTENERDIKTHIYVLDGIISDYSGVQITITESGRR